MWQLHDNYVIRRTLSTHLTYWPTKYYNSWLQGLTEKLYFTINPNFRLGASSDITTLTLVLKLSALVGLEQIKRSLTTQMYLQLAQPPFTTAKSHSQLAFWPQLVPFLAPDWLLVVNELLFASNVARYCSFMHRNNHTIACNSYKVM